MSNHGAHGNGRYHKTLRRHFWWLQSQMLVWNRGRKFILPHGCRFIRGRVVIRGNFSHAKVTPTIPYHRIGFISKLKIATAMLDHFVGLTTGLFACAALQQGWEPEKPRVLVQVWNSLWLSSIYEGGNKKHNWSHEHHLFIWEKNYFKGLGVTLLGCHLN